MSIPTILISILAIVSPAVTLPHSGASAGHELKDGQGFNLELSYNRLAYTTKLSLGSPPQEFKFVVGSLYQELWVRSANCTKYCDREPKYNSSMSSTYKADGRSVQTGEELLVGNMTGYLSMDTVSIGSLKIDNVFFGEINLVFGSFYERTDIAGSLGLGFKSNPPFKFFVDDLLRTNTDPKVTGFYFKRIQPSDDQPYLEHAGHVTIGSADGDRSLYDGNIHWVKTDKDSDGDQTIPISGISFGTNMSLCGHGCNAVIDAQQFMIGFPGDVSFKLNQGLGFMPWIGTGYFTDCNRMATLPNVTITIDGFKVSIPPSDYLIEVKEDRGSNEERLCLSAFYGVEGTKTVLGTPFLFNSYTLFDYDQDLVGLAQFKPESKKFAD